MRKTISKEKIMEAIESAWINNSSEERGALCYLIGYLSADMQYDSSSVLTDLRNKEKRVVLED